jgi:hypothetical protein
MIANTIRRQAFDRVVEHLHVHVDPLAVVGETCGRDHSIVGNGGASVVELQQEAGIDDHLVFRAHRRANRDQALLVALVVFVLAVRDDARGRRHRQERLLHVHAIQRSLEVLDVALELGLPGIINRPDADRVRPGRNLFMRVELGIELGEALPIAPR